MADSTLVVSGTLLLVEVAAMGYPDDNNFAGVIIDLVAHAPISHTNSPDTFFAFYFQTSGRRGSEASPKMAETIRFLIGRSRRLRSRSALDVMLTLNINLARGA